MVACEADLHRPIRSKILFGSIERRGRPEVHAQSRKRERFDRASKKPGS